MSNYFTGTVNPNIKGGSSVGDTKTGGGVGIINQHPASGLGSNWNMGDALSSPKGEWDYDEEDYLEGEEEIDDISLSVNRKSSKSFNVTPTDSLAFKGTHIGYLGGIGAISLRAGKEIEGLSLVENYIKEYVKEVMLLEKTSISGRISVKKSPKAKNFGSKEMYSVDGTTSHTNKLDNSSTQKSKGIDQKGIGQTAITPKNLEPYVVPGLPPTDTGLRYIYTDKHELEKLSDQTEFNNGKSTYEFMINDVEQEDSDVLNFLNNNKRSF